MAVAFGMDANKDACLDRNTIRAEKLEKMARKGLRLSSPGGSRSTSS